MTRAEKAKFLEYLLSFITENKQQKFEAVIRQRTRHITVLLEDIYQPQNASAVLRSCDCFGIQDVHIIENQNEYNVNPDVALGSAKWLNLYKYNKKKNNTAEGIKALKEKGYRIIATTPHTDDQLLDELDVSSKLALMFGTEMRGLSEEAWEQADEFVKIPMYGFTESFNISVSAAICLHHLSEKMRQSGIQWQLSEEEMLDIKLQWAKKVVKKSDAYEKTFMAGLNK